jgi:hypothetical protein
MMFLRRVLWKSSNLVFFIFFTVTEVASAQSESWVDQLGINGSIRTAYWNRDKSYTSERDYAVGSAWLTMRPQEIFGLKFYADGFVQGQNLARDDYSRLDLRELYVEKSWGDFDFKVGRAITVWGRADKVNPTDVLSVRNYQLLMTDDEDQRTGVFQLQATYNFQGYRLSGLWIPEWRSPVYPIPPVTGVRIIDQTPEERDRQLAFKLDHSGDDFDWSMSFFKGNNKLPDLRFVAFDAGGVLIAFDYGEIEMYGADFATNYGDYGFRGELAYTKTADNGGDDPFVQNSQIYAVLGVDRTVVENFNINVQYLFKHVVDYQSSDSLSLGPLQLLAEQGAINANQIAQNQSGLSIRPSYKMYNDTLEMEIALVSWFEGWNSLVRPKITYAFSDSFKGIIGGEFYSGPDDTLFGRLQPTSTGFAELRWYF